MLISETEFRLQVEDDIRPFRDILLGFFFITIGMKINLAVLQREWLTVLVIVLMLIALKTALMFVIARAGRHSQSDSFKTALYLAQGGEFGFVLLNLALQNAILQTDTAQLAIAAILFSMLASPFLIRAAAPLADRIFKSSWDEKSVNLQQMLIETMQKSDHVIIVGFGHTGQTVARLLEHQDIKWYALDLDADRVQAARLAGEPVSFGDAKRREILEAAGLARATMLVITAHRPADAKHILHMAAQAHPGLPVIVRARHLDEAGQMLALGADEVIADDSEMGLVLASQIMVSLGMSYGDVFKMLREARKGRLKVLQGYFVGSEDGLSFAESLMEMQRMSLIVPEHSLAVGENVSQLPLKQWNLGLLGVRRGAVRHRDVAADFVLRAQDVLLVLGHADEIRQFEAWLQQSGV